MNLDHSLCTPPCRNYRRDSCLDNCQCVCTEHGCEYMLTQNLMCSDPNVEINLELAKSIKMVRTSMIRCSDVDHWRISFFKIRLDDPVFLLQMFVHTEHGWILREKPVVTNTVCRDCVDRVMEIARAEAKHMWGYVPEYLK